jgi:hypothetical protein
MQLCNHLGAEEGGGRKSWGMQTVLSERFWKDPYICCCLFHLHAVIENTRDKVYLFQDLKSAI